MTRAAMLPWTTAVQTETGFRAAFAVTLGLAVLISGYHRWKARQAAGTIPRGAEDTRLKLLRLAFGVPLLTLLLSYMFRPTWIAWAQIDLPAGVRWLGVLVAAGTVPFLLWVFRSLGVNVSETVLTRADHRLVSHGPYRWIRHPLYSGALVLLLALSVVAANWLMGLIALAMVLGLRYLVAREEAELRARFGSTYDEYMSRTGRFVPLRGASRSAGS